MRHQNIINTAVAATLLSLTACHPTAATSSPPPGVASAGSPPSAHLSNVKAAAPKNSTNISLRLFAELEELSRIVDISYCVGTTGIRKPFSCASRCDDFPAFELVDTFNTGPLMSDSCGYIVLDHGSGRAGEGRVIVAFRGTYSIANTIVDLSTVPQEYVPYPGDPGNGSESDAPILPIVGLEKKEEVKCGNCTVHSGFWTSWQNTRPFILPHIEDVREKYPHYKLNLVGHSLGGAVAALAGLEFDALGWAPTVTTFGEPKVGNAGLRTFIDRTFGLPVGNSSAAKGSKELHSGRYRRITHVDDPVPLLPLREWGYRPHAGEIFISKGSLQPSLSDLRLCYGDEDQDCMAGADVDEPWLGAFFGDVAAQDVLDAEMSGSGEEELKDLQKRWGVPIPSRYKVWQLFFAHRDYFWRLGLCVSGGDPTDWGRDKYNFGDDEGNGEGVRVELV